MDPRELNRAIEAFLRGDPVPAPAVEEARCENAPVGPSEAPCDCLRCQMEEMVVQDCANTVAALHGRLALLALLNAGDLGRAIRLMQERLDKMTRGR